METFEKHIANILNDRLLEIGDKGEFFFIKNYQPVSSMGIFKKFCIRLIYKTPEWTGVVLELSTKVPVKITEVDKTYDTIFEKILYKMIFEEEIWNSINTKLQSRGLHLKTVMQEEQ